MQNILAVLLKYISDPKGIQWCNDLIIGDVDCQRLAVCLAIELRKPTDIILDLGHINIIFNSCDYNTLAFQNDISYPRKWFAKRLDDIKDKIKNYNGSIIPSNQQQNTNSNTNTTYVTFLWFSRLLKYYLKNVGFSFNSNSNDFQQVIDFVTMFPDLLDDVDRFGNTSSPVWVTTKSELNRIQNNNPNYTAPTNIMIMMGLQPDTQGIASYPYAGSMFFLIEYPSTLNLITYQPTSLNKNWIDAINDLYLSYIKKDCYGMTYSSDASCQCTQEQIHESFLCKDKGCSLSYIGEPQNITINKSKIITEGLKRFNL